MVSVRVRKKNLKKNYSDEEIKLILTRECKEKISPSKKRLEAIAKAITPLILENEGNKNYLHYCSYHSHPGILGKNYMEKKGCLERECTHYKKLYLK